jgi:nucleotide-binding universal stress UspA family protein
MYETVLVPTDGGELSISAAEEAVELANSTGTIHVLAVIEELPMYKQSGKGAKIDDGDKSEVREYLEAAADRIEESVAAAEVESTTTITTGVPHREILSYAEEIDADAIVMGKRGQGAAAGDILGSTTERVIKGASSTVVTVPEP